MNLVVWEGEGNPESGKQHPSVGAVMVGVGGVSELTVLTGIPDLL